MGRADIASRILQINTDINYALRSAYESEALTWHRSLLARMMGESATLLFPFAADETKVSIYYGGERTYTEVQLGAFEVSFDRYSKGLKADRDAVLDDKTGLYMVTNATNCGKKFAKLQPQLAANVILDNPVCMDGQPLFSASHPRNPVSKSGTVWTNAYTSMALTPPNVQAAIQLMEALPDPDGSPKNVVARCLIVPTALTFSAEQIAHSVSLPTLIGAPGGATAAVASDNPLKSKNLVVVSAPHLGAAFRSDAGTAGSDTTWYMADVRGAGDTIDPEAAPLLLGLREAMILLSQQAWTDPSVFDRQEFKWIGTERLKVAPGNPAKIARFTA